jgi:hypothetical protein
MTILLARGLSIFILILSTVVPSADIQYMRGVDRFDQSMNDYNISQRSNRWYLRIDYYFINATLTNMRTVTKGIVKQSKSNRELMRREGGLEGTGKADPWEMYTTKMMGWCTWLVHLGFGLISI